MTPIATITTTGGALTADSTLTVGLVTVPVPQRTAGGQTHRDRRIAEAARAAGYERTNGDWYVEDDALTVGVVRRHFIPGEPVVVLDEHGQPDGSGRFSAPLVDGRFVIMVGGSRRDVHAIRLPRADDAEWGIRDVMNHVWMSREYYSEVEANAQLELLHEHMPMTVSHLAPRVMAVGDGTVLASTPRLAELEREVARLRDGLVEVAGIAAAAHYDDTVDRQSVLERVADRVAAALDGG